MVAGMPARKSLILFNIISSPPIDTLRKKAYSLYDTEHFVLYLLYQERQEKQEAKKATCKLLNIFNNLYGSFLWIDDNKKHEKPFFKRLLFC